MDFSFMRNSYPRNIFIPSLVSPPTEPLTVAIAAQNGPVHAPLPPLVPGIDAIPNGLKAEIYPLKGNCQHVNIFHEKQQQQQQSPNIGPKI